MSAPPPIDEDPTNVLRLAQLAAVLRPAFRCATTPVALHELFAGLNDAVDGIVTVDATEAMLRSVIMLRNALEQGGAPTAAHHGDEAGDATGDDADPEIGLHLALFGVESLLARMGWTMQRCP